MTLTNAKYGKIILYKERNICKLFNWRKKFKIKILFDSLNDEINTKYFKADTLLFGEKTGTNVPGWITKKRDEIFCSVYHTNKYDYSLHALKKFFRSSKYSHKIYDAENIEIISIYCRPDDDNEVILIIKLFDDNSNILFTYDSNEFTENEIGVIIGKIFEKYED